MIDKKLKNQSKKRIYKWSERECKLLMVIIQLLEDYEYIIRLALKKYSNNQEYDKLYHIGVISLYFSYITYSSNNKDDFRIYLYNNIIKTFKDYINYQKLLNIDEKYYIKPY